MIPYKVTLRDRIVCSLANFILQFGSEEYLAYIDVLFAMGREKLEDVLSGKDDSWE